MLECSSNVKIIGNSCINKCDNFGQAIMRQFEKLDDEFALLSDRLDKANMPETSRRLTNMLSERRRLVLMLCKMGQPPDGSNNTDKESSTFQKNASNPKPHDDAGAFRKNKSVHWSDEQLGGSIIQEPNNKQRRAITSSAKLTHIFEQSPSNGKLHSVGGTRHSIKKKLKVSKNYSCLMQANHLTSRDAGTCDGPGNICAVGFGHAAECVKDILDEAAALRKEACYMLWKARYLEQLCDVDGIVKRY